MTSEERQALEDEQLRLQVVYLRKKIEVEELQKRNVTAELTNAEFWHQPHRLVHTNVFRSPNGDNWVCVPYNVDRGDLASNYPYGEGRSPQEACDDFDRTWRLGDYDEEDFKGKGGGLAV
jgi:hypothetical protein